MSDISDKASNDEFLGICSVCKSIRIPGSNLWLNPDTNPDLYNRFYDKYKDNKLTHTYCPPCFEKAYNEINK